VTCKWCKRSDWSLRRTTLGVHRRLCKACRSAHRINANQPTLCREFLRHLRSAIEANKEAQSVIEDSAMALEPSDSFFASLSAEDAAAVRGSADQEHAGSLLRLLLERRRRQELHERLQSARAEQVLLRVQSPHMTLAEFWPGFIAPFLHKLMSAFKSMPKEIPSHWSSVWST
jgi:hypothetical protein